MEVVKINLNSPIYGIKELTVLDMKEANGELLIKLGNKECYDINGGEQLIFKRYVYRVEKEYSTITSYIRVNYEDENHILHCTIPLKNQYRISGMVDLFTYSAVTSSNTDYHRYEYVDDRGKRYYRITMQRVHNLFAQDLACDNGQEVYIMSADGNKLTTCKNIFIPLRYGNRPVAIGDCIRTIATGSTCGKDYRNVITYLYEFLPDKISDVSLLLPITEGLRSAIEKGAYIETKYNPFYFYKETDELDNYGNPIKQCAFWNDPWWAELEQNTDYDKIYLNYGNTRSFLAKGGAYWNVGVGLESNADESSLGMEDDFNSSYVEDVEDSLIPDVIDMERIKYVPYIESGDGFSIATSITMDFHFRKRVEVDDDTRSGNTSITSGNVYADGWYISKDDGEITWWNGLDYEESEFNEGIISNFIESSGDTSDLLGYLNFTDNDVYYQKKKVSQSFIRLSFYSSTDPVEQKLLFYSTSFLDGTGLYGKYIKQLNFMLDNDFLGKSKNPNADVVFCSATTASARVDSQMVITNEYDKTKSSEGFNIYLFRDDVDIKDKDSEDNEKSYRTIYMKVEFNHAGNGKTIPMILWPKKNGKYVPLTTENFVESLYIPIQIRYYKDKYIYTVPSAKNENDSIILRLFEPKLDQIKDDA